MPSPDQLKQILAEASRKPPAGVLETLRVLEEGGHEAYLVGGCVRDLLLGRSPEDYDVATSARPEVVMKLFRRVIPTGLQHGTVTVLVGSGPNDKVEVTTYRGEGEYVDGRRPKHVEFISDLDRDLARRDFTVNAIAFDPVSATVEDPFQGVDDLRKGILRAVGDAGARFGEDGLRTLRAVRFASTLGFNLDPATEAAIPSALATFRKVSAERVRDELNKLLLRSPRPSVGVELLYRTGLFAEILPEITPPAAHMLRVIDILPPNAALRWAGLLEDQVGAGKGRAILDRLRQPIRLGEVVELLIREQAWRHVVSVSDAEIRRHLARIGYEHLEDVLALRDANAHAREPTDPVELAAEADLRARCYAQRELRPPLTMQDLALNGGDVMALAGRGPGAYVGKTLRALLGHVHEHPEDNTREKLEALAREQLELSRPR